MDGPAKVMIIRHGEKPADEPQKPPPHGVDIEGRHCKHSLLPRGWQRAGALATIFGAGADEPLATPQHVFAPDYGSETAIHRTTVTVTPLAHKLSLAVRTPVPKGEEEQLVSDHLMPADGTVVVCWEHHHIPDLAQEFAKAVGVSSDSLPANAHFWPEDDYWSVIVFTRNGDGYDVTVTSEDALVGDPAR